MFNLLSRSNTLKRLASSYGMATPRSFARRFIAGEQVEDAIAAARALQAKGLLLTLDYLGESVTTTDQATAATREYVRLIERHCRRQHRAQHLGEADAIGTGDRPRDLRRQHATDSRAGTAARVLRTNRYGELVIHGRDARSIRDIVDTGVPQHRRRAAVVPAIERIATCAG